MILKRPRNRYDEIKRLAKRPTPARPDLKAAQAAELNDARLDIYAAELGQTLVERAYGHSQQIAILHDVSISGESIDHLLIDGLNGTLIILSNRNLGAHVCQEASKWTVFDGHTRTTIEDPRRRVRRQLGLVREYANNLPVVAVVLVSPGSRCETCLAGELLVMPIDRFESWMADRRHGHDNILPVMSATDLTDLADRIEHQRNSDVIQTAEGTIRIRQLPSGQYAIRNKGSRALIDEVRKLVRGRGWWNPKYHNWVVSADLMEEIRHHFK